MKSYGLALHTSSPYLGLALGDLAGDYRWGMWLLGRDLSSHLHHHLAEFLGPQTWSDVGFVAVARGPGSFTGTRLGMVVARTLAQQLNIPLYGVSTLGAAAWEPGASRGTVVVTMAAPGNQVYGGVYQRRQEDLATLLSDQLYSQDRWQQTRQDWPSETEVGVEDAQGVLGVLGVGLQRWRRGETGSWAAVLPLYPGPEPASGTPSLNRSQVG